MLYKKEKFAILIGREVISNHTKEVSVRYKRSIENKNVQNTKQGGIIHEVCRRGDAVSSWHS